MPELHNVRVWYDSNTGRLQVTAQGDPLTHHVPELKHVTLRFEYGHGSSVENSARTYSSKLRNATARAEAAVRKQLDDGGNRDLSGWTAEENAEFEKLYGIEAAMRLRAANNRAWAVVQELRDEQNPVAQRLSAALVGEVDVPQDVPSPAERPVNSRGLIDTLLRVSGLNANELGRLIGVSGKAVRLWSVGGAINQAHYERALDLNERMQKLPSKTFYNRREALFDASGGRSMYDQMLAELSTLAIEPEGPVAYFNVQDG